jgi:hypothetical protein
MRPEERSCRVLPGTKHFTQLLQARQPRNVSPIPTRPNTPTRETVDLNAFTVSANSNILTTKKSHRDSISGGPAVELVAEGGLVIEENEEIK